MVTPFLNLIFTYFLIITTPENLAKFHRQVFIASYLLKYVLFLGIDVTHTKILPTISSSYTYDCIFKNTVFQKRTLSLQASFFHETF